MKELQIKNKKEEIKNLISLVDKVDNLNTDEPLIIKAYTYIDKLEKIKKEVMEEYSPLLKEISSLTKTLTETLKNRLHTLSQAGQKNSNVVMQTSPEPIIQIDKDKLFDHFNNFNVSSKEAIFEIKIKKMSDIAKTLQPGDYKEFLKNYTTTVLSEPKIKLTKAKALKVGKNGE